MKRDSSHLIGIELPEVIEAKKDVLTNNIVKNIEQSIPQEEAVIETQEINTPPTYNYLQQTELFQL